MNSTKETEVFVDCIASASLRDGVIRLEFGEFEGPPESVPEAAEGKQGKQGEQSAPRLIPKHRIFMPVPGFIRSLGVMQEVMKRLAEQGAAGVAGQAAAPPVPVAEAAPGRNGPFVAEAVTGGKSQGKKK